MIDVFTHGSGPFVTPLCKKIVGVNDTGHADAVILEFRLEDGAQLLLPIARDQIGILSQLCAVQDLRQGGGASGQSKQ